MHYSNSKYWKPVQEVHVELQSCLWLTVCCRTIRGSNKERRPSPYTTKALLQNRTIWCGCWGAASHGALLLPAWKVQELPHPVRNTQLNTPQLNTDTRCQATTHRTWHEKNTCIYKISAEYIVYIFSRYYWLWIVSFGIFGLRIVLAWWIRKM